MRRNDKRLKLPEDADVLKRLPYWIRELLRILNEHRKEVM